MKIAARHSADDPSQGLHLLVICSPVLEHAHAACPSHFICCCRYVLVHASTGAMTEMFTVGRASGPCMTSLSRNELLVAKDNVAIIVGPDGRPSRKVGI